MFIKPNSCLLLFLFFNFLAAQSPIDSIKTEKYTQSNKGKIFVFYGGNGAIFTDSSLRISGEGYDFILHHLKAEDRPTKYPLDYLNPLQLSTPQTNYRIGYFFSNKYNISFGLDHMKYVMVQDQSVKISGTYPTQYDGNQVNNGVVDLSDGKFLKFEHTNGLNYINVEVARFEDLSKYLKIKDTDKFQLNLVNGLGAGILFPRTDATLFNKPRHDEFNVAGYGIHTKVGLNFLFFKHYFIQTDISGGYINMNNVKVSYDKSDKGSQDFFFLQGSAVIGTIWKIF